jgi:hypothetical protein
MMKMIDQAKINRYPYQFHEQSWNKSGQFKNEVQRYYTGTEKNTS